MSAPGSCTPVFQQILNFRDVGTTADDSLSLTSKLKEGVLFRSARPDIATEQDRAKLKSDFGIKTIIDLRSKTEHINAAKKYSDAALAQPGVVPSANSPIAIPLKISGIRYAEISLTGKSFERALLWRMSWAQIGKLAGLMALGYRTEGISILGKNVMQPRGLVGLGKDTLDYSGKEIKEVLDILADEQSYPVLVHCTQGKDRTGLIILLASLLCGVDVETISQDYVKSEKELEPEMKQRLEEIASIGLDSTFAGCPVDFVEKTVAYIEERYGGIRSYLISVGVDEEQQQRIRTHLQTHR